MFMFRMFVFYCVYVCHVCTLLCLCIVIFMFLCLCLFMYRTLKTSFLADLKGIKNRLYANILENPFCFHVRFRYAYVLLCPCFGMLCSLRLWFSLFMFVMFMFCYVSVLLCMRFIMIWFVMFMFCYVYVLLCLCFAMSCLVVFMVCYVLLCYVYIWYVYVLLCVCFVYVPNFENIWGPGLCVPTLKTFFSDD